MPLVLNASNNGNYGGNLINQKYSPLANIQMIPGEHAYYRALFTARQTALTNINAYPPNTLRFYANFPVVNPLVAPIVVVSSGRAVWMQTALQCAVAQGVLAGGYGDTHTFDIGVSPWYAPERSGNRQVYVVVHWSEYDYYDERLGAFPNVTVVGYKFDATAPALDIVGFGASRYAAIELMIDLGYHRAWSVDDNVVNVNGFPALLATVEAHMTNADPAIWGIGFNAAVRNHSSQEIRAGTATFNAAAYNFNTLTTGMLQQVVLWNLDLLRPNNLNFCPLFVASAEDVSLSKYMQTSNNTLRVITACRVIKGEPQADPNTNRGYADLVPRRRNRILQIFNGFEGDIQINPGVGGPRALSTYVTQTILPAVGQPSSTALITQARAIEQVMAAAAARGWYPGPPVPFNPYNGAANVQRLAPAALPTPLAA